MSAATVVTFLLGSGFGWATCWAFARAHERHRRIRRDIKTSIAGLKTLTRMLRRETGNLVRVVLVLVVVLGVLVLLVRAALTR